MKYPVQCVNWAFGTTFRGKMFRQRDLISSAVPVLGIWNKYALEQFQGMHYHCFPTDLPRRYIIFTQHRQLILKNNRQSHAPVLWWHDHVFLSCILGKQNDFQIGNLYSWKRLCLQKVFSIGQHLCKPNVVDWWYRWKPFSFARNVVWSPIPCCSFLLHVQQM